MKAAIACALTLSLLTVAHAITTNGFSDAACATQGATTIDGMANPLVCKLNECCSFLKSGGVQMYVKATACDGTTYAIAQYNDNKCASTGSPMGGTPGTCIDITSYDITGLKSIKTTCASASSATLALLTVAAAAIAFCM